MGDAPALVAHGQTRGAAPASDGNTGPASGAAADRAERDLVCLVDRLSMGCDHRGPLWGEQKHGPYAPAGVAAAGGLAGAVATAPAPCGPPAGLALEVASHR